MEDLREQFEKSLEALLVCAVRLAIIRHDLRSEACFTLGEDMTDERAIEISQDAAWAVQGEGTCSDEPVDEWKAVVGYALGHPDKPSQSDLAIAKALRINFCDDLAADGAPWEVAAEPEPSYFETLPEAVAFYAELINKAERGHPDKLRETAFLKLARRFYDDAEALLDWMNGNDLVADHAEQCPDDYERICESLQQFGMAIEKAEAALGEQGSEPAPVAERESDAGLLQRD